MRLFILGSNGLLGNTIAKYFLNKPNYITFAGVRNNTKISLFNRNYLENFVIIKDVLDTLELEKKIKVLKPNVIINCTGINNKKIYNNLAEKYITINSLFPHKLSEICFLNDVRLIQFSSDCVFSGKKGFYNESDNPDPIDLYGRSKLLGEVKHTNTITIRKSAIGHELCSRFGLLEWFLNQEKKVKGYKNVIFSGLTVLELAKIIDTHIIPRNELNGIFHIAGEPISKLDLLKIIAYEYKKTINIIPDALKNIDRSLNGSYFNKLTGYKSKKWPLLIKDMHEFNLQNK